MAGADPAGVQLRHRGRVDQARAHLQPGEVGAGQAGALPVQELVEGGVHADPHDERGVAGVGQDQRRVLRGRAGLEPQRTYAEPLDLLGGPAVSPTVDAQHDVASAAQRLDRRPVGLVGTRVEHHDVGSVRRPHGAPRRPGPRRSAPVPAPA